MKTITVFTPTYNRAYILPQLYESLKRQTSQDFCWLIVDDGSTDNTKELVESWISESIIPIRYFYQENGGKNRAHNYGVTLCNTELFMCCDSDDYLTDDAVELICKEWYNYHGDKELLSGIIGPRHVVGIENHLPEECEPMTYGEFSSIKGRVRETFLAFRTKVIAQYPFPIYEGEYCFPEGYIYNKIDYKYKMLIIKKELMICQYLNDGYSRDRQLLFKNPHGYILAGNETLKRYGYSKKGLVGAYIYAMASLVLEKTWFEIIKESEEPIMAFLILPLAYIKKRRLYK